MSDRKWGDGCLVVTPGAFRGTRFVLYVAADAAEMVNVSYAWLVQIVWIEGSAMALLAGRSLVSTIMMAHSTILSNTLM